MKFADRSQTDVYAKNRLGDFLTATTSYPMEARQMGKQCCESGAKPDLASLGILPQFWCRTSTGCNEDGIR